MTEMPVITQAKVHRIFCDPCMGIKSLPAGYEVKKVKPGFRRATRQALNNQPKPAFIGQTLCQKAEIAQIVA